VEIGKEAVTDLLHGHATIGVARKRVVTMDHPSMMKGIMVRAPGSGDPVPNTAPIWVGGSGVTADSVEGTGGIPIPPGECVFVPLEVLGKLYAVSTVADQDLAWMAM